MNLTKIYQELHRMAQDGQSLAQYLREQAERDPVLPFLTQDVASLRRHFIGIRAANLLDLLNTAMRDPNEHYRERRQVEVVERELARVSEEMLRGAALEDVGLSPTGKLLMYAAQVEFYQRISKLAQED